MNALLFAIAIAAVQPPALPTATVSGDVVTVTADFAYIDSAAVGTIVKPVAIPQGTMLAGDQTLIASSDGKLPVAWKLLPGAYKVTAFSYPANRLVPVRTEVVLDVLIQPPTRPADIRAAFQKMTEAKGDLADARAALDLLKPTRAELRAAALPIP